MNYIEKKKQEQLQQEKYRQAVRENSSDLRELERKLKEAYINKERAIQVQESILKLKQRQVSLFPWKNSVNFLFFKGSQNARSVGYSSRITKVAA